MKIIFPWALCLFLLSAALRTPLAQACSCMYAGDFLEYAKETGVIHAKVLRLGPSLEQDQAIYGDNRVYMDVQVIDVLKGEYKEVAMRLVGDNGAQCLSYVNADYFRQGREFMIAFIGQGVEQHLLGCGEAFVRVENGKVHGKRLTRSGYEAYELDLTRFIQMIYQLEPAVCPVRLGSHVQAIDVYDGSMADMAILVPDEASETQSFWNLAYVYAAGRTVNIRCKYSDKTVLDVELKKKIDQCGYEVVHEQGLILRCR